MTTVERVCVLFIGTQFSILYTSTHDLLYHRQNIHIQARCFSGPVHCVWGSKPLPVEFRPIPGLALLLFRPIPGLAGGLLAAAPKTSVGEACSSTADNIVVSVGLPGGGRGGRGGGQHPIFFIQ
jgi:hypothetical protein